jgi:hypothetical protein
MALAVTNIVGVPIGGFGVHFEDLSEDKATQFFKVRANRSCIDIPNLTAGRSSSFSSSGTSSQ